MDEKNLLTKEMSIVIQENGFPIEKAGSIDNLSPLGRYINPFTDWGFKRIFKREQHKDLLITFLNDLFAGEKVITDVTYLESDIQSESEDGRNSIFDIICTDQLGERYIIEMQNSPQVFIFNRIVYYTCKLYSDSGIKGPWNFDVKGVIAICLANFNIYGDAKLKTEYELIDNKDNTRRLDKIKIITLQLTKVPTMYEDCDTEIKKWLHLLVKMAIMDNITLEEKKAAFKKLLEVGNVAALNEHDRAQYECNLKSYLSYINQLDYAEKKGMEKGIEKGVEQIAIAMIREGLSPDIILKCTGLSLEQIEKL